MMKTALSQIMQANNRLALLQQRVQTAETELRGVFAHGNLVTVESMCNAIPFSGVVEIGEGIISQKIEDSPRRVCFLVRFAPYVILGAHKHDQPETILLVDGTLYDGPDKLAKHTLIPEYEVHSISAGRHGATCIVIFDKTEFTPAKH